MRRDRGLRIDTSPFKENSGSEYLLDSVTNVSTTKIRRGRRLLLKGGGGGGAGGGGGGGKTPTSERIELGHFEEPLRRLSFTDKELLEVIDDRDGFHSLQNELRKKGAVTNSLVKEGIHFYVQNRLEKKHSDSPTTMASPKKTLLGTNRRGPFRTPPRR